MSGDPAFDPYSDEDRLRHTADSGRAGLMPFPVHGQFGRISQSFVSTFFAWMFALASFLFVVLVLGAWWSGTRAVRAGNRWAVLPIAISLVVAWLWFYDTVIQPPELTGVIPRRQIDP